MSWLALPISVIVGAAPLPSPAQATVVEYPVAPQGVSALVSPVAPRTYRLATPSGVGPIGGVTFPGTLGGWHPVSGVPITSDGRVAYADGEVILRAPSTSQLIRMRGGVYGSNLGFFSRTRFSVPDFPFQVSPKGDVNAFASTLSSLWQYWRGKWILISNNCDPFRSVSSADLATVAVFRTVGSSDIIDTYHQGQKVRSKSLSNVDQSRNWIIEVTKDQTHVWTESPGGSFVYVNGAKKRVDSVGTGPLSIRLGGQAATFLPDGSLLTGIRHSLLRGGARGVLGQKVVVTSGEIVWAMGGRIGRSPVGDNFRSPEVLAVTPFVDADESLSLFSLASGADKIRIFSSSGEESFDLPRSTIVGGLSSISPNGRYIVLTADSGVRDSSNRLMRAPATLLIDARSRRYQIISATGKTEHSAWSGEDVVCFTFNGISNFLRLDVATIPWRDL